MNYNIIPIILLSFSLGMYFLALIHQIRDKQQNKEFIEQISKSWDAALLWKKMIDYDGNNEPCVPNKEEYLKNTKPLNP